MLKNIVVADELDELVERCAMAHHPHRQSMKRALEDVRAALLAAGANVGALESFDARHRARLPIMIGQNFSAGGSAF
ncbi:hypothetical protein [uncultured Erythrobacter sp.]|uniref:hypothetical protein n=1 Tax=uncultured Erythrobacter sp. TaxID=263913 RepID=UPI0026207646|nr:hypothetical protein [uncultured Erythrobacter sp.]